MTTVANSGVATCWLTVNATGDRLYTANNGDNSVSVYDLADPLAPVELQHLGLAGGSVACQLCLDPAGDVLYVVSTSAASGDPRDNVLHQLAVDVHGMLTEPAEAVLLAVAPGVHPAGVAALPDQTGMMFS